MYVMNITKDEQNTITGISTEYYEAAMIDGATRVQQARYITLPHLEPIIIIMLIQAIGGIFHGDFGLFYSVPRDSGVLYPVTNVIDTYIFRALKDDVNYGMSSAAAFYQSIVGFILLMTSNAIVRKVSPDYALF
jgi:putative aldouronate transport system permease protein